MFLISTIKEPCGVHDSALVKFFEGKPPILALARQKSLDFYGIDPHTFELNRYSSFGTSSPIKRLSIFRPEEEATDCIVALFQDNLVAFIKYSEAKQRLVILDKFVLESSSQGIGLETKSTMIRANVSNDRGISQPYIIFHTSHSFVTIVDLNAHYETYCQSSSTSDSKKKRKLKQFTESTAVSSLGNIVVQDMATFNGVADCTLAVLYRDFQFNHSLRFYRIKSKSIEILKQHQLFSEPPSLLIKPKVGGVFVLSDIHIYYFISESASIMFESEDPELIKQDDAIVKRLYGEDFTDFIGESWYRYEEIDDSRILVISESGTTCLLHFDIDYKSLLSRKINVKSINLISLGKTTCPTSVLHVDYDLFFVSSSFSNSLLFTIGPSEPHINLILSLESSPPILDFDTSAKACEGGPYGGALTSLQEPFVKFLESSIVNYKCKSSKQSPHIILLSYDSAISRSDLAGSLSWSLTLVNSINMKSTDNIRMEKSTDELIDIIYLGSVEDYNDLFVVLKNGPDFLMMIQIKDGKLNKVPLELRFPLDGEAQFHGISLLEVDAPTFYLTGNSNFALTLLKNENGFYCERVIESWWNSPTFSISSKPYLEGVIVCDAVKGLYHHSFSLNGWSNPQTLIPDTLFHKNHFVSTFDIFVHHNNSYLIYGDISGKIGVINLDDPEPHPFVNLNEPVNTIKAISSSSKTKSNKYVSPIALVGTACGGVYSIGLFEDPKLNQKLHSESLKVRQNLIEFNIETISANNEEEDETPGILNLLVYEQLHTELSRKTNIPKARRPSIGPVLLEQILSESTRINMTN